MRNHSISPFQPMSVFCVALKECCAPRLPTMVTCVDGQACCCFHGMVQCYGQMLRVAVTICSNYLHRVTSLQTALVLRHNYTTVLCYTVTLHVCTCLKKFHFLNVIISIICLFMYVCTLNPWCALIMKLRCHVIGLG